jgi:hypothetical protein
MQRLFFILVVCMAIPSFAAAEKAWVQVRETKLRSQPKFYASGSATLRYGQAVDRVGATGGWVEVSSSAGRGYLPITSLSRDQIVLSSKEIGKIKADSTEVVLAGKGFSKEVEEKYKALDSASRFDLVDKVELSGRVSAKEVEEFAKVGGLVK